MKVGPFLIALVLLAGCVPGGSPLPTATAKLYGASIELPEGATAGTAVATLRAPIARGRKPCYGWAT